MLSSLCRRTRIFTTLRADPSTIRRAHRMAGLFICFLLCLFCSLTHGQEDEMHFKVVAPRQITEVVNSVQTREGAGFIVSRPFPTRKLDHYDPFLLLDHFGPVTYGPGEAVGAPWHPHRGFETVSYILRGEMQHRDSMGNKGTLRNGDVQWMTAGAGIIHDEEPSEGMKKLGGTMEGFQIWVNLPKKFKMIPPAYQDVSKDKIPTATGDKYTVKIISGEALGQSAIIATKVPLTYLDFHAEKGAKFTYDIPEDFNAVVYVYRGEARLGSEGKPVKFQQCALLKNGGGSRLEVEVTADDGAKFLLLAGKPLNEPVARYGPFVMNDMSEIHQAFADYQSGKLASVKAEMLSKAEHDREYDPETDSADFK